MFVDHLLLLFQDGMHILDGTFSFSPRYLKTAPTNECQLIKGVQVNVAAPDDLTFPIDFKSVAVFYHFSTSFASNFIYHLFHRASVRQNQYIMMLYVVAIAMIASVVFTDIGRSALRSFFRARWLVLP